MNTVQVLMHVFLVLGAFALTGAASLRRTSLFLDRETPRRQYEELIASRQIRSHYDSEEERTPSPSSEPNPGALKFHTRPPLQLTVAMNDRLELTCDVSGAPPPAVYWLKNGHPIPESPFHRETREESDNRIVDSESQIPTQGLAKTRSRLVIDCVDGDAEAIYTCVAESVNEKVVSSTYVHIDGEVPMNESVCSQRHLMEVLPANIFMWSGTYIEAEGKDAVLLCRAAGNPTPKIFWTDGEDQPIVNDGHFEMLNNGDLVIRQLSWAKHMGLYKCKAENEFGIDETATFVYPVLVKS